jgi:heterotetrameric sarcosine oxidase gamma subunit
VTDPAVSLAIEPASDVVVLDLWDGALPSLDPTIAILPVEPQRWWLIGAAGNSAEIAASIAGRGSLTPIGGGMMRATLTGAGWRGLLTISGCFDSESPVFTTGKVAATVIHHVPVWIAVTDDTACAVYFAASYAPTLAELWATAIGAGAGAVPPVPVSAGA